MNVIKSLIAILSLAVFLPGISHAASGKPHICFAEGSSADYAERITSQFGYQPAANAAQLNQRWSATATDGPGLLQGDPTTITWSYIPDGTQIPGGVQGAGEPAAVSDMIAWLDGLYGPGNWHILFEQIFANWSDQTGINYVYEPNDDGAPFPGTPGDGGTRGDVRIGGHLIDGNSGILAYNFFPQFGGDMVIDSADNFYNDLSNNSLKFRNVIAHEAGHGMGLNHNCPVNQTKLMEPFVTTAFDGPRFDDVLGAQRHYGDAHENNDNPGVPTDWGPLNPGDSAQTSGVSIDGTIDEDVFSFTSSGPDFVRLSVAPTAVAPYLNGPQANSCTPGTPFDPRTVNDLQLELLDTDGITVLASKNSNPAGMPESIEDYPLAGAGTYFMRVSGGNAANAQIMDVDIEVLNTVPTCAGVPLMGCTAAPAGSSGLSIKPGKNGQWKQKGPVSLAGFGDVTGTDGVASCWYVDGALVFGEKLPAGAAAWSVKPGKKIQYKDKTAAIGGITKLLISSKGFKLRLDGSQLPLTPLSPNTDVTLQLVSEAGACYESVFTPPLVKDTTQITKAKQ